MSWNERENTVTYCLQCGSTIFWDAQGDPMIVRPGNQSLLTCLELGCTLVSVHSPDGTYNFELLRRRLIETGVPEETAMSIAAIIATHEVGAAAA